MAQNLDFLHVIALDMLTASTLHGNSRPPLLEGDARLPVYAVLRAHDALDLGVQIIDLLQRQAFRLVDEEVHKGNADKAAAEPDEEDLGLHVGVAFTIVDEIRGGVSDGPVEQPL